MGVNLVTSQMDPEQAKSAMQTLLTNCLEQQQWALAMPVAHWLAANGDDMACALRPQLHNYLDEYESALEALSVVPVVLRHCLVVRRAEASALYALGYHQLAREVLLRCPPEELL